VEFSLHLIGCDFTTPFRKRGREKGERVQWGAPKLVPRPIKVEIGTWKGREEIRINVERKAC